MAVTREVSPDPFGHYFAEFTRRFLRERSSETADVEALGRELGSQIAIQGARVVIPRLSF